MGGYNLKKFSGIVFLTILFFLQLNCVFAESSFVEDIEHNFELLDRDDGLSNLSVSSIVQDKYGFVWFGTQGGLNCYDGREMTIFRNDPFEEDGLIHNLIQTIYYDEELHELWIGTYQGISRYIISENRFINYSVNDNNLSNPIVIAITKDQNGHMWFGTMDGLNRLDIRTDTFEYYEVPGKVVRSLLVDSTNRIIVGTYEGLAYFDEGTLQVKQFLLELPSPYVMVVKEFETGILTLGLWDGGVVELEIETNEIVKKSYADNRVYTLIKPDNGALWVGTWGGGLFIEDQMGHVTHFESDGKENNLSHNVVYALYQDASGIFWIGTNGGGVNKINPRKHNFVDLKYDSESLNSISQGKINKIYEDSEGNLWIAVYNNGLNKYNQATGRIDKYNEASDERAEQSRTLPDNQINEIIEIGGKLIIGTNSGLARYDRSGDRFIPFGDVPENTLIYSIESVNQDELWIGTYNNGVSVYNMKNHTYRNYKSDDMENPVADNLIYDIHVDQKGPIWIATNNGLNMKEPMREKFKLFRKEPGNYKTLASNTMRSIYEDSSGRIWITMVGGGIAYFVEKDESFVTFTEKDGLPSNVVSGVVEDDKGSMWCSTENGLAIIQEETEEIFYLTPDDGIGGWEFSSGVIKVRDGSIILGSVNGITRVPSSFILAQTLEPRVYIKDVLLFHEKVNSTQQFFNDEVLTFGPNESSLEFRVVALDFDAPLETRFSYKLEGFDEEWIRAGTRDYIAYSNLPAGTYELKVIAETARNAISQPASLTFSIEEHWYKTPVAYILYAVTFALFIIALIKIREGRLMGIRNSKLSALNTKLEEANVALEKLSTKDPLTGLFNRRYFDMMFLNHLKMAIRSETHLALFMIDIDDFKYVNDKFGHVAGDYLLKDIAIQLEHVINRATDFVVRYGGDEFIVVLYDTECVNTERIAHKITDAIKSVKIRADFTDETYYITTSIGIGCSVPSTKATVEDYLDSADKALYTSKQNGKNRVSINEDVYCHS